jgi:sterol desaturase/sphingolipid hydroxylase (fatty acid hydroxylase superfamily)
MSTKPLAPWIAGALGGGALLLLTWLERRKPLRRPVEPKWRHEVRNLTVAGLSAIAIVLVERPVVMPLASWVEGRNWGVLPQFRLPQGLQVAAALVLMDYTFYLWHVLMHRIPFLWRFHLVHHVDLDLDASTALRFHFTEMLASVPWRAGQVLLIGLTPFTFSVWQCIFLVSILFHHSNIELPIRWERLLNKLIVTPRMHGIHHSIVERETNSNWSSGLTVWDWLHGTLRLNVPQPEVTVGVPAFQATETVTLPRVLAMPFEHLPPSWQFRTGDVPEPHRTEAPATVLLP